MVLKRTGDGWSEDEKASAQEVVARKFHRELPKSLFLTMSDVRPLGVAITTYHHPVTICVSAQRDEAPGQCEPREACYAGTPKKWL